MILDPDIGLVKKIYSSGSSTTVKTLEVVSLFMKMNVCSRFLPLKMAIKQWKCIWPIALQKNHLMFHFSLLKFESWSDANHFFYRNNTELISASIIQRFSSHKKLSTLLQSTLVPKCGGKKYLGSIIDYIYYWCMNVAFL